MLFAMKTKRGEAAKIFKQVLDRNYGKHMSAYDIAVDALRNGDVPGHVFINNSQIKIAQDWLCRGARNAKNEHGIRRFGVYWYTHIGFGGKVITKQCWKEWHEMSRHELISARAEREEQKKNLTEENQRIKDYCDQICLARGEDPIEDWEIGL